MEDHSKHEKTFTTDDSGVLISIEEYASLHGETSNSHERNYFDRDKTKNGDTESVFQKIVKVAKEPLKRVQKPQKIECRYCHKFVKRSKIGIHNQLHHPDKLPANYKLEKNPIPPKVKKKSDIEPEGELGNMADAFRQAFNETRYGAKGMHHRREWDGKFGSTPLHDDYNDESGSE